MPVTTKRLQIKLRTDDYKLYLHFLPPEILLKIFSYLESNFMINTLSIVCKAFNKLINDNYTWKSRINFKLTSTFPCIPVGENFNWKKAVSNLDTEYHRWKNNGRNMNKFTIKSAHYSFIHAIHLFQNGRVCVSGSRDCALKFWDLDKLTDPKNVNATDALVDIHLDAHKGWIWTITSSGPQLCTGGWDAMLHLWDLENGCRRLYSAKCKGAVLCASLHNNVAAAGTYGRRVSTFDMRRGMLPVKEIWPHSRAVLAVHLDDKHIISASEDATISVYDRTANKTLTTLECPNYVMSMSYRDGFLYGGDKRGVIHLWDVTENQFKFVQSFDVGHDGSMTGLSHNFGCVISGCTDRSIKVSSTSLPIITWASFEVEENVGDLYYLRGVLAASSSDAITIWKPNK
uniref:F-box domain-containing protein n=1 Tax=Strigamia maritima TaxID=126957 RepID=T1JGX8_STRMM